MKNNISISILLAVFVTTSVVYAGKSTPVSGFQENKGQIRDQNYNPRPDVLFSGSSNGITYHLTNSGISYQLSRIDSQTEVSNSKLNSKIKVPDQSTIYRIDVKWLGVNRSPQIQKGDLLKGEDNYYLQHCPNGALNVRSYASIMYENIYDGIDLKWYKKEGNLEYDFIVKPNIDISKIKFEINGAQKLFINTQGELEIKTPLGVIIEKAPVAYQNNKEIKAEWLLVNDKLSFKIASYDKNLPLIIDPVIRVWGTYYGSSGMDHSYSCITDGAGDVYMAGSTDATSSVIATAGSHQTIFGGGTRDAFLVKFDNAGVRQWGTYYGGVSADVFFEIKADASGNVYAVGETQSSAAISTPGAHQNLYAGGLEAMLVKFNSSGVRQWATYYGTTGAESAFSCAVDAIGDVYVAGSSTLATSSGTIIATVGSHQPASSISSVASFLVKFNSSGVRQWGTYYGGGSNDRAESCTCDATGNVYLSGRTSCAVTSSIATVGSHQPARGGIGSDLDGYLVKFNSSGIRQWGTYYGGSSFDYINCCTVDALGFIYIAGSTNSQGTNIISTAGCHQPFKGSLGSDDAFLVKFNSSGVRQWGTYYGGPGNDGAFGCVTDASNNVYFCGDGGFSTGTAIAIPANHQSVHAGNDDAFLVKFNSSGVRQWGTYYGGTGYEYGYSCAIDAAENLYLTGNSDSNTTGTEIATPGSHQTTNGGLTEAYLAKFIQCSAPAAPINTTPVSNQAACHITTATLSASGSGTINWYSNPTSSVIAGSGNSYTTSLPVGSYTFYAAATNTCSFSYPMTAITVTFNPNPVITVNSGTVCYGDSYTITPGGASTYTIEGGSAVVTPTAAWATYTVIGTNSFGCVSIAPAYCTISVNFPTTSPTITTSNLLICVGQSATLTASGANSYTWSTSATGSVIVVSPTTTTSYTATAIDPTSGCPTYDVFSQSVSPCTDIMNFDSEKSLSIEIYPNPNNGEFILTTNEMGVCEIINSIGQAVKTIEVNKESQEINIVDLEAGIYYLRFKNQTVKLILLN